MKFIHDFQNEGFNWFAVDQDGNGFEFIEKPVINGRVWHISDYVFNGAKKVDHGWTGDWECSIRERLQFTSMKSHTNEEIAAIRNPVTYKEALDEQAGCKITELKEQGEWVDGLPPVGEVCEIAPIKSDIWTEHKVLAYYGIHAWIVEAGCLDPGTCLVGGCKFRPILTPKQRTIEAAKLVAVDNGGEPITFSTLVINRLSDAGMLTLPGESK